MDSNLRSSFENLFQKKFKLAGLLLGVFAIYACCMALLGVDTAEYIKFFTFYSIWILWSGFCVARLVGISNYVSIFLAPTLGFSGVVLFFLLGLGTGSVFAWTAAFPVIVTALALGRFTLRNKKIGDIGKGVGFNNLAALAVFSCLVCSYFLLVYDVGISLPTAENESPFLGVDIAWFMGNIASVKRGIFPADFRVSGLSLQYHFLLFQVIAAYSSVFSSNDFVVLTRLIPITNLMVLYSLLSLVCFKVSPNKATPWIIIIFCFFASYIGFAGAYEAQWNIPLNFFTSPTVSFSFIGLVAAGSIFLETKGVFPKRYILLIIFFFLVGAKISTALAGLSSIIGMFLLAKLFKGTQLKIVALDVAFALFGVFLGCLYFFSNMFSGGLGGGNSKLFSGEFVRSLGSIFPIQLIGDYAQKAHQTSFFLFLPFLLLSLFLRLAPILIGMKIGGFPFLRLKLFQAKNGAVILFFLLTCLAGVSASFIVSGGGNPLHFYHVGIFSLGVVASIALGTKWENLTGGYRFVLLVVFVLSIFPHLGDAHNRDVSSKRRVSSVTLDGNLFDAYLFIKKNTSKKSIILSNKIYMEDHHVKGMAAYFYGSAIAERQFFLEGWAFSSLGALSPASKDISDKLELIKLVYGDVVKSARSQLILQSDASVVVWDIRTNGPVPSELSEWSVVRKKFGPVIVFLRNQGT